jgi:hypothetical protein
MAALGKVAVSMTMINCVGYVVGGILMGVGFVLAVLSFIGALGLLTKLTIDFLEIDRLHFLVPVIFFMYMASIIGGFIGAVYCYHERQSS